jgi:outer membrane protein
MRQAWLIAITVAAVSLPVYSQWSAGVAGIGSIGPYKGISSESIIIPIAAYEGERLTWRGPSIQYKLIGLGRGESSISVSFDLAPNELEADQSNELAGIENRDFSFLAGVRYSYPSAYGELSFLLQTDVSGRHDGQRGSINFNRAILQDPKRQWVISAGVQLEYLSDNYADYYFGVSDAEAAQSAFSQYQADALWQAGLTLGGFYRFYEDWQLVAQTRYLNLAEEVTDSPLVEDDFIIDGFVGVTYQF